MTSQVSKQEKFKIQREIKEKTVVPMTDYRAKPPQKAERKPELYVLCIYVCIYIFMCMYQGCIDIAKAAAK